jgi:hypothetical protein
MLNGLTRHRRPRRLSSLDADAALVAAQTCRRAMQDLHRAVPVPGPEYEAASAVVEALDGLAEALTGDRRLWRPSPTRPAEAAPRRPPDARTPF